MRTLNYEAQKALHQQLFHSATTEELEDNCDGWDALNSRWVAFSLDILLTDEIVHLWPSREFREAYYCVNNIHEGIQRVYRGLMPKDEDAVYDFIYVQILEESPRHFELLIEAAKIIMKGVSEGDIEDYKRLIKDLEAFLAIAKIEFDYSAARDKYSAEMVNALSLH